MNEENITPSSSDKNITITITIEEIKLFYKDRFIDYTRLPFSRYNNITNINLTKNIKYIGKIDSNDIWLETENNIYLCGIPFSPTRSWYKIKELNDIDIFQNYFTKTINSSPTTVLRFGIKLDKMKFNEFIQFIYFHQFTDKHLSETSRDLNNSIKDSMITYDDQIRIFNNYIKQNLTTFYIKTKYSKSIIYCEYFDNNIIVNVLYNELKLKNRYDKYPIYIPSDISIIFNSFDKFFYEDIIYELNNLNNLNNEDNEDNEDIKKEIDILFKICDNSKIKKDINIKKINSDEIKQYILDKFKINESNILFNKIEKEGIFKAFENSLDILIKTFYEKLNESENNIDSFYLTEKLKKKINEIFYVKLI
jgi:hypothetical protein